VPFRASQGAAPPVTYQAVSPKLAGFLFAVVRHKPGENDDAVSRLAPWPRRDLEPVIDELKRLAKQFGSTGTRTSPLEPFGVTSVETLNRLLKRAAMLDADVATFRRTEGGYSLPPDTVPDAQRPIVSDDGRVVGVTAGTFHWEAARRLLESVRPSAGADADVRLWYQMTAAVMQAWTNYYELRPHMAAALALFPDDATLLLYDGTSHESYAEPGIQNTLRGQRESERRRPVPTLMGLRANVSRPDPWIGSPAAEWQRSQILFERALAIDSALSEARIRLAHVLGQQEKHEAASAQLKTVLNAAIPAPPFLRYLAWMLLGKEEQTRSRYAEAEAAYDEAARLYPQAQSPRIALSQVAREQGDHQKALQMLELLERAPEKGDEDPWRSYDRLHVPGVTDQARELAARLSR
jgi:tetratricopeptide (TPR) repeat protein